MASDYLNGVSLYHFGSKFYFKNRWTSVGTEVFHAKFRPQMHVCAFQANSNAFGGNTSFVFFDNIVLNLILHFHFAYQSQQSKNQQHRMISDLYRIDLS